LVIVDSFEKPFLRSLGEVLTFPTTATRAVTVAARVVKLCESVTVITLVPATAKIAGTTQRELGQCTLDRHRRFAVTILRDVTFGGATEKLMDG
jgi:hypothetical protein